MLPFGRDPYWIFLFMSTGVLYYTKVCASVTTQQYQQRNKSAVETFVRLSSNVKKTQLTRAKIKKARDKNVFHLNAETNKTMFMSFSQRPATAEAYDLHRGRGSKNNVVNNKMQLGDERRFNASNKQFGKNDFENKSVANEEIVRKDQNRIERNDDDLTSTSWRVKKQLEMDPPIHSKNAERAVTNYRRQRRETYRSNKDILELPTPVTNEAKRVTALSRRKRREADKSDDVDTEDKNPVTKEAKRVTALSRRKRREGDKSDDVDTEDKDADAEPDEAGKTEDEGGFSLDKVNISPMYLIPPLIILGLSPVILANLKVMVMNALMINNMALSSALFMTLKNMVFGATGGSKVKYTNYGYQNTHAHSRSGNQGNYERRRYYV